MWRERDECGAPVEGRGVGEAAVEHAVDGCTRLVSAAAPGVHGHGELCPPLHAHLPAQTHTGGTCADGGVHTGSVMGDALESNLPVLQGDCGSQQASAHNLPTSRRLVSAHPPGRVQHLCEAPAN